MQRKIDDTYFPHPGCEPRRISMLCSDAANFFLSTGQDFYVAAAGDLAVLETAKELA